LDDDDEPRKPKPAPRTGLLPTGLSRAIVIATILLCATIALARLMPQRYVLVPVTKSDNALAYRIDGLTGRVSLCSASQCQVLDEKAGN
jgi:hypothetical protein